MGQDYDSGETKTIKYYEGQGLSNKRKNRKKKAKVAGNSKKKKKKKKQKSNNPFQHGSS